MNLSILKAKPKLLAKKEGDDQLIVMFIIIPVAVDIADLLYIFATGTQHPPVQDKIITLIDSCFDRAQGEKNECRLKESYRIILLLKI